MIELAAQLLNQGHVVALPTDTVYGLAASLKQPKAIKKIFDLKHRASEKALPVMVSSIEMLRPLVIQIPKRAEQVMQYYWPGALTIVLLKSKLLPDEVTQGKPSVAVRIPQHPFCLALLEQAGPLAVTSANRSGAPALVTYDAVKAQFGDHIHYTTQEDAFGKASSTIIDFTQERPVILRQGELILPSDFL